jgi:hypothetical protein
MLLAGMMAAASPSVAYGATAGASAARSGSIGSARAATGAATSASDVNGDGFADQAIGAFHETVGSISDAGGVNVLYGTAAGLQADAPNDQFFTAESFGGASEAASQFGWAMAAGDFNGDGFGDLAISVPFADVGSIVDAGAIWIVYGSPNGLSTSSAQLWTQDTPGVKGVTEKEAAFGRSLSVGDFNGHGFADLAIGSRKEDVGHANDAGAVEVLFGTPRGIQADAPDDQLWTQDSLGVRDRAEAGDWLGRVSAAGDWNNDGFDDLAIGVPFEDLPGGGNSGAVEVLYGTAAGLQAV